MTKSLVTDLIIRAAGQQRAVLVDFDHAYPFSVSCVGLHTVAGNNNNQLSTTILIINDNNNKINTQNSSKSGKMILRK